MQKRTKVVWFTNSGKECNSEIECMMCEAEEEYNELFKNSILKTQFYDKELGIFCMKNISDVIRLISVSPELFLKLINIAEKYHQSKLNKI